MRKPLCFAAVACLTLAAPSLDAQGTSSTAAHRTCFRARPLAECGGFWITEFGVAQPLGESDYGLPLFTWEVGGMKNLGAQTAVGATVLLEQSGLGYGRVGVAPRFRYWATEDLAVDLSAGVTSTGWIGRAGVSFADYVGASIQAERNSYTYGRPTTTWYVGARLGAIPGAVADVAAIALLIIMGTATAGGD